ncbi:hypothetical protein L3X38_003345 [Prunus dulcis]|uniref:Uncharacterized protein n=1 Tax=Prunus dulcis TaxID=3755 RepID=A0AAD4ZLX0_PRUDU|nr:hypothetical protein L3X38_003345 [Prunus dulcis]
MVSIKWSDLSQSHDRTTIGSPNLRINDSEYLGLRFLIRKFLQDPREKFETLSAFRAHRNSGRGWARWRLTQTRSLAPYGHFSTSGEAWYGGSTEIAGQRADYVAARDSEEREKKMR